MKHLGCGILISDDAAALLLFGTIHHVDVGSSVEMNHPLSAVAFEIFHCLKAMDTAHPEIVKATELP